MIKSYPQNRIDADENEPDGTEFQEPWQDRPEYTSDGEPSE